MEDRAARVRVQAALALWRIEHAADPSTAVLIEALRDPDAWIRLMAAAALSEFGEAGRGGPHARHGPERRLRRGPEGGDRRPEGRRPSGQGGSPGHRQGAGRSRRPRAGGRLPDPRRARQGRSKCRPPQHGTLRTLLARRRHRAPNCRRPLDGLRPEGAAGPCHGRPPDVDPDRLMNHRTNV